MFIYLYAWVIANARKPGNMAFFNVFQLRVLENLNGFLLYKFPGFSRFKKFHDKFIVFAKYPDFKISMALDIIVILHIFGDVKDIEGPGGIIPDLLSLQ